MVTVGWKDVRMATVEMNFKLIDEVIELDFIFLEAFYSYDDPIDVRHC